MANIGCPRAQSDTTPCIARDGRTALATRALDGGGICVGCEITPRRALEDLAGRYEPARGAYPKDTETQADAFSRLVGRYVEGK